MIITSYNMMDKLQIISLDLPLVIMFYMKTWFILILLSYTCLAVT